ncbi:MAG: SDR family oxidoreductase [Rhodospirillales bacterium]|nr:SDR family oxidoreductase [Rhodospirillales bacterium]
MDLGLEGKVALVSGGNRGIGLAIARRLAAEGCNLMLVARDEDALATAARTIVAETARRVEVFAADIGTRAGIDAAAAAIEKAYGRIDILINNAGSPVTGDFLELDDAAWQKAFAVKVFGCVRLSRALWPMLKESHGAVINMSGTKNYLPAPGGAIGGAMNAAVTNFSKVLANQGLIDDVNVNTIHPGIILGALDDRNVAAQAKLRAISADEIKTTRLAALGVRRFGEAEDVADVVAFLVSPVARHIQGTNTVIDGGNRRMI